MDTFIGKATLVQSKSVDLGRFVGVCMNITIGNGPPYAEFEINGQMYWLNLAFPEKVRIYNDRLIIESKESSLVFENIHDIFCCE